MKPAEPFDEILQQIRGVLKVLDERLDRVESQVALLVRAHVLRDPPADTLDDIHRRRFAYFSQHEEDGMLYALLEHVGIKMRHFVEIGCGGNGGNSGFLARECGWSGLMVDGAARAVAKTEERVSSKRVRCVTAMVSSSNVRTLLAEHDTPPEPDILSVDIDSTDYWVLQALTENYRPRVLVTEYNSALGAEAAVTVPDAEGYVRPSKGLDKFYYGASLRAFSSLADRRGYRLVIVDPTGTNAIFVRNDLAPTIPAADPSAAYRIYWGHRSVVRDAGGDLLAYFRSKALPLIEV